MISFDYFLGSTVTLLIVKIFGALAWSWHGVILFIVTLILLGMIFPLLFKLAIPWIKFYFWRMKIARQIKREGKNHVRNN